MYYRETATDYWEESDVKMVNTKAELPAVTFEGDLIFVIGESKFYKVTAV